MRSWRTACVAMIALMVTAGVLAPPCHAQVPQTPELLLRLWPLFRSSRPVPLLPSGDDVKPTGEDQPKRPLIAPFPQQKLNINTCRLMDLQDLPGVGPAMGAHIMAGRPYRDFQDLERDGVPLDVVQGLKGKISFGL